MAGGDYRGQILNLSQQAPPADTTLHRSRAEQARGYAVRSGRRCALCRKRVTTMEGERGEQTPGHWVRIGKIRTNSMVSKIQADTDVRAGVNFCACLSLTRTHASVSQLCLPGRLRSHHTPVTPRSPRAQIPASKHHSL